MRICFHHKDASCSCILSRFGRGNVFSELPCSIFLIATSSKALGRKRLKQLCMVMHLYYGVLEFVRVRKWSRRRFSDALRFHYIVSYADHNVLIESLSLLICL